MGSLRSPILLLVALATALTFAGPANAALPWAACTPSGYRCAKLGVQLDRSGAVPGTITLDVKRRPSPVATRTAVVAIAGGPGQAAVPFAADFAQVFASTLADKDLIVWNQRGTGNSGPLSCPSFRRTRGTLRSIVQSCSQEIGAKRAFYTTAQSVQDLESIRVEGGYDQLIIYGVSYGTKVALDYAAAYPTAVQSLILDSVVPPEGPDALRRSTLAALPRVIGQDLCEANACAAASSDPVGQLRRLAATLGRRTARGSVYNGSGRRSTASLGEDGLLTVLLAGDLNPALRAELPGAVSAAISGDRAPILRLSARAAGLANGSAAGSAAASGASANPAVAAAASSGFQRNATSEAALYYATICEENTTLPWTRGAPVGQRIREAEAAVRAQPAGTFGLFGSRIALSGLPSSCLGWTVAGAAPAAPGPLPDVPVLLLGGQGDLRTPLEDAQNVAARFPRAQLVAIPDTGHSVVSAELGTCAKQAVRTFLAGGTAAGCTPAANQFAPTARPPRSLGSVSTVRNLPATVGRTLNAFSLSLGDGTRQVVGESIATGERPRGVGGLRSGSISVRSSTRLLFRNYEYVPGVKVSGTLTSGTSTFRISGSKAATGTVTLRADGSASGRLGGRRFSVRPRAAAASLRTGDLPTIDEAVAIGRARVR